MRTKVASGYQIVGSTQHFSAQHPSLRDLIWVVLSPSLLSPLAGWPAAFDAALNSQSRQRLEHTDPRALDNHLSQRETRFLGSYFEALWEFFFVHEPRFEIVARNLQIRDANRTLGELDFVIFDRHTDRHLHLELAIKFYLGLREVNGYPYTDGRHLWVGPQARDRLDIKLARTLEHQLTLSEHPLTQARLRELGVSAVEPQFLFKGCLFQPDPALPLPDYVLDADQHARWFKLADLVEHLNDSFTHDAHPWYLLQKRHWPAPPYLDNLSNPLGARELGTQLQTVIGQTNRPYMIVQTDYGTPVPQILRRYFVTPDGWPKMHR